MSSHLKPHVRSLGRSAAGLALAVAAIWPLQALAADPAPVQSTAGQIVVKDAASGQLRAATAAEAHALLGASASRPASLRLNSLPRVSAGGARGARLSDDQMSYSMVVRNADGSTTEYCVASREDAEAATRSAPAAKNHLPTE